MLRIALLGLITCALVAGGCARGKKKGSEAVDTSVAPDKAKSTVKAAPTVAPTEAEKKTEEANRLEKAAEIKTGEATKDATPKSSADPAKPVPHTSSLGTKSDNKRRKGSPRRASAMKGAGLKMDGLMQDSLQEVPTIPATMGPVGMKSEPIIRKPPPKKSTGHKHDGQGTEDL